jgi:hypothetical protein
MLDNREVVIENNPLFLNLDDGKKYTPFRKKSGTRVCGTQTCQSVGSGVLM